MNELADLQELKNVFKKIGCKFEIVTAQDKHKVKARTYHHDVEGKTTWDTCIKLNTGIGYSDFFCEFYFLNGVFQNHGCWE